MADPCRSLHLDPQRPRCRKPKSPRRDEIYVCLACEDGVDAFPLALFRAPQWAMQDLSEYAFRLQKPRASDLRTAQRLDSG
jgi:hypothetical protein